MREEYVNEILASLPARISQVVTPWADKSPERPALVEGGVVWTYGQLASQIPVIQQWLTDLGVRAGDRVMLVGENCCAFAALLLAISGMDAWPVLVNARLSAREVDDIRDHCEARRIVFTTDVSPHAAEHAKRHNAIQHDLPNLGTIAVGPLNEETEAEPVVVDNAGQIAVLLYTSGTTGRPKGVMLTHRNLLYIAAVTGRIRSLTPEDRMYGALPLSHIVGLSVVLLGSLMAGSTLYLATRFDPVAARATFEKEEITVMLGVPAMYAQFLQYAKMRRVKSFNFPALRIISCSGAPLYSEVKAEVESLFGMVLNNGYGVTECSPNISQTRIDEPRSDTSVGRIFPGVEVKITGPDGVPLPDGEVGELRARGPNVMKGYYRAPEDTAAVLDQDGWFNTRDLAKLEDKNLFIAGRAKELIIHSGFNIYPAEIEAVLNKHPEIVQSAVIGQAVRGDEEVIAFVQLVAKSSLGPKELAEFAAPHLASYKRPKAFIVLDSMPTTLTGKVIKSELAKLVRSPEFSTELKNVQPVAVPSMSS